jgi:small GTP-binding protein
MSVLARLLPDRTRTLVAEERGWLTRLQRALHSVDAAPADRSALDQSIAQLDHLFLLVVIGEFNAGKSAFINALLGARVVEEGVTPTTTRLQILRHGETGQRTADRSGADIISAPAQLLEDLTIVDTPGTNAIFREHERLTTEFVPRADLVLFVTSADRPFTESERSFLDVIRNWGKKIVVVINKIDLLEGLHEREQVRQFVAQHARTLLGAEPTLFTVSARRALRHRVGEVVNEPMPGDEFEELEHYITTTLDQKERLRLKLLNPIGIGVRLAKTTAETIDARIALLGGDLAAVDDIERQLDIYRADLAREFEFRLAEVDNVLHQFENRGVRFFDDTLRIGRLPDLVNKARIQHEFERDVVADVPRRIESQVHELIDWMVASALRQWEAVTEQVNRRRVAHVGRIMGGQASGFQYDRAKLIATVGRAATQAIDSYDREREAAAMADGVRTAVAGAALAQVGAVGLGAVVTALATTTAADVTGIVAAGTIAVLGMFVIPSKRAHAKAQLRRRIEQMRTQLMENLRGQFGREVERSTHAVRDAVAPYTQFVRAEHDKLSEITREIDEVTGALSRLRTEIERGA